MAQESAYAVVTHQKGAWKWEDRYALVKYKSVVAVSGPNKGAKIWKRDYVIDNKLNAKAAAAYVRTGYNGHPVRRDSLQNVPVARTHAVPNPNPAAAGIITRQWKPVLIRTNAAGQVQITPQATVRAVGGKRKANPKAGRRNPGTPSKD